MTERISAGAREARQNYLKERKRRNLDELDTLRARNQQIRTAGKIRKNRRT